uniref:Hcy-binding domain-containing protein n=1 Tax=Anabas testudineus TaxID=64144 RepID=A0A7N6ALJ8_ANATE
KCSVGEKQASGILERLDAGEIVIGDGGFVFALEKRGYVKAGPWTPEAAAEHPEAGAQIVGVNCHFDPVTCVKTVKLMKEGVEKAGLKAHFMSQPLAYHTPDCNCQGFIDLPEFPFSLEPRILTRWDMQKYAREAYNAGIRYIGGCCGFEPYHIRALAEELKHGSWGSGLEMHTKPWVRARARRDYWENLKPASGRPFCPSMATPDGWGVTKGHADLMQQKEATSEEQLKALFDKASKGH